jgi:2-C-methyl-D-erythritol 4-phosphate cytidylyltransferase
MIKYAIIVAGGTGSRMQGDIPKQFLLLNGKPVIQHSLEVFYACDASIKIVLVIHPDYLGYWEQLCREFNISVPHAIALGGETRFHSVKNGLNLIDNDGFVAVHDAARPVLSIDFINTVFSDAALYGCSIPGIALQDTIRQTEGDSSRQLDRTNLRAIQTPQVFRVPELKRAYEQPYQPGFTDDASVMQSAGFPLHLTQGRPDNIKITNPQDISVAEVLLKIM